MFQLRANAQMCSWLAGREFCEILAAHRPLCEFDHLVRPDDLTRGFENRMEDIAIVHNWRNAGVENRCDVDTELGGNPGALQFDRVSDDRVMPSGCKRRR